VVPSDAGQETAVAVGETLELTLDEVWETVEEIDDELLSEELDPVAVVELLADELEETTSLAPDT
jgi:hypothetical protein